LLTISTEPKARLWDLGAQQLLSELELGPLTTRAWRNTLLTRDRRRTVMNVQSNVIEVLDVEAGIWLQPRLTMPTEILRLAMSADGNLVALSSASELRVCKFGSEQPLFPPIPLRSPPEDLRLSDDGRWLACSFGNKVWLMNTSTGAREPEFAADAFRMTF